ncbi:pleiotropic regulator 1-like [Clytia hemisphaerica]|uniref:Pleiotropic regulator 1 n=1 Tax=Clytia hemisphaerica TaxID=252671 RepID=A0A7M5XE74_9CNID
MAAPAVEDIPKHSVHTLVFRSIKRSHDMFLSDHAHPIPLDKKAEEIKRKFKIQSEYANIQKKQQPVGSVVRDKTNSFPLALEGPKGQDQMLSITGPNSFPSTPGVSLTEDTASSHRQPSAAGVSHVRSLQPISQSQIDANKHAHSIQDITNKALASGGSERIRPNNKQLMPTTGESKVPFSQGIVPRKGTTMPKPRWHAPWKLMRVVSGHTGWVRCVALEPANQWFCTGSADRTIKIWDLATSKLKLSLTGHISTVRGLVVSPRHPYLFSCGEDKTVKCWDLEYNKVTRSYHGHLSACYGIDIHPTVDVIVTVGRDSTARVWDIRTKAAVHSLTGHTNTIADVKCQGVEPQIITGSHDCTVRYWDLVAGKSQATLTNHKKSIRSLVLHPTQYTMASGSADNIKQWKFPDGNFIQNLSGHNSILNCMAINSDGVLVSGGDNGSMHLWDWKTGYNFQRTQALVQPGSLDSESGIFSMTFDLSGTRLITTEADKTIKIYKEDDEASEESHPINWKPDIIKRKKY